MSYKWKYPSLYHAPWRTNIHDCISFLHLHCVSLNYKYACLNHVSLSCKIKVSSLYHMFLSYKCYYISLSKLCTLYVVWYPCHKNVSKNCGCIVVPLLNVFEYIVVYCGLFHRNVCNPCYEHVSSIYLVHFHKVRKILNSQNLIYMTSNFWRRLVNIVWICHWVHSVLNYSSKFFLLCL